MLSVWLRAIRIKFLLASVIAVSLGLSVTWWHSGTIDIFQAALTMGGVIALHASVDLLNYYWDFKRGIDTKTKRTRMEHSSYQNGIQIQPGQGPFVIHCICIHL